MKKNIKQQATLNEHPFEKNDWIILNDMQKAKVLMQSTRLLDVETFICEFKSFEEPDISVIE